MWQKFLHKTLKVPYILNSREYQAPKKFRATVILLHGIGSSMAMWEPLLPKMPKDVRIIAIDLLGFGESPKPSWNVYGARMQADSLATTLFSMKIIGPVVVVGHSLGSLVAIEFARRYPLMTKSLVLISPPLYKPDRDPKRLDFKPEEALRQMYALMATNPGATEKILRMGSKYRLFNKGFDAKNVDVPAYLATLETAIINQQSYHDILRIRRPIHVVTGKLDIIVLDSTINELERTMPNVQHTSVIGTHEIVGPLRTATQKAVRSAIDEATTH